MCVWKQNINLRDLLLTFDQICSILYILNEKHEYKCHAVLLI